ncbi:CRP-like cAMP-binding protein [Pedobacter cryoconitis]|uniref:CRP-like cAMP-binding protein n=1 Tax=Pedobacter cryoconitis TaxID=188932 RepID=A0A7W8ZI95_9SPHI|nr:Crp/Fnr family transcriptional regulator [Pedobacter cryoconitis]MBB5634529.1 CRP-like cAMP-binding protein [Pedobacter cryoconitis]MBB6272346.1 CRP-like cAMP-binding protein [Pedobacter cryoconitis]
MDSFIKALNRYAPLSTACINEILKIVRPRTVARHDFLLRQGSIPRTIAFVKKGLFSYYYTTEEGNIVIKKFFAENSFVASTSAMIKKEPGLFNICALEDTEVLEYDSFLFWRLIEQFPDLAMFHIKYMEKHWIADKEVLEITAKYQNATQRYQTFLLTYPELTDRLKQHHIASYLGITPTQLSRIRREL